MIEFRINDLERVVAGIRGLGTEVKKIQARAVTRSTYKARDAVRSEMQRVFDRPKPYTLNQGLAVKPAEKTEKNPEARLRITDYATKGTAAWRFLSHHVEGGARVERSGEKRLRERGILGNDEFVVPGRGVKLDRYGNVTGATMNKILSNLGARFDPLQNTSREKLFAKTKRGRRRARGVYFYVPEGPGRGIWFRDGKNNIRSALIFTKKNRYRKRLDFYGVAERTYLQALPGEIGEGLSIALRRLRF